MSSDIVIDHIAALLRDIQCLHSEVFTPRAERLTLSKVKKRFAREGISFATKALPRLARALDRALTGEVPLNSVGWRKLPNSQLPIFMGELFQCIFSHDGWILPTPCVDCIIRLRDLLYSFYKYKLPYSEEQERSVLESFRKTEDDLNDHHGVCAQYSTCLVSSIGCRTKFCWKTSGMSSAPQYERAIYRARASLEELFLEFDEQSIVPKHGPGAVSTKEIGPGKYKWTTIPSRITEVYPIAEYFYPSLTAVCDRYDTDMQKIRDSDVPAKVVLVPKDSRGPRIISEECLANQFIQQGLMKAIVKHVELHPLTRYNVHFTDQRPNQLGALLGSQAVLQSEAHACRMGQPVRKLQVGKYATLDLKEASDRVSLELVHLLWPKKLVRALESCRSLSTVLPSGEELKLKKFAPMGSACCFPVMALTIWAILNAAMPDADARESILVYGDDVIVKTAQAANAMNMLESFGLKINRDKSCTSGFFRESCGVDAFRGRNVTPVRIRTVWNQSRCPDVLESYCTYANAYFNKGYVNTGNLIAQRLIQIYGFIPVSEKPLGCPHFVFTPPKTLPALYRTNRDYQIREMRVWATKSETFTAEIDPWMMLLRFFTEVPSNISHDEFSSIDHSRLSLADAPNWVDSVWKKPFGVRQYTMRHTNKLVRRWVTVPVPSNRMVYSLVSPSSEDGVLIRLSRRQR